jgi:RNA recognition motif-containing protein
MSTRVYVGNLPYSATNEQLTELFAPYGEITEVTIPVDRDSGRIKGFGFVQMTDDAAARTAIDALNGTTFGDRTIRVNEAQARPERSMGNRPRRSNSYGD